MSSNWNFCLGVNNAAYIYCRRGLKFSFSKTSSIYSEENLKQNSTPSPKQQTIHKKVQLDFEPFIYFLVPYFCPNKPLVQIVADTYDQHNKINEKSKTFNVVIFIFNLLKTY